MDKDEAFRTKIIFYTIDNHNPVIDHLSLSLDLSENI